MLKFLIYLRAFFPDHSILWMTLNLPCSSSSSIIYRVALGRPRRERMVMVVDDFVCYTTFDVVDFNPIWMQEHNILLQRNKIPYRSNTGQRTGAYRTPPDCSCCAYRRSACTHQAHTLLIRDLYLTLCQKLFEISLDSVEKSFRLHQLFNSQSLDQDLR